MLMIKQKIGDTVRIGDGIEIYIAEIGRYHGTGGVILGITAPKELAVIRDGMKKGKQTKGR